MAWYNLDMEKENKKLVLITGMSGAGKTTATNMLEDLGYYCIDGYPNELLEDLLNLIKNDESYKYNRVALSVSLMDYERYRYILKYSGIQTTLIMLKADKDSIINRYKFTRRVHPLVVSKQAETLEEAVDLETKLIEQYENDTVNVINTGDLTIKQHKDTLDKILSHKQRDNFSVSFISFGFKYGVPMDADFVFDVRVLDNPFYVEELRNLTGNDQKVYDYVINEDSKEYLDKLCEYLDVCFASYAKEDRRHLSICIGCTGGQHRSVSVTNYLYEHYSPKILCYKYHREVHDE